jgi:hypothetical protein
MILVKHKPDGKLRDYTHIGFGGEESRGLQGEQTPLDENEVPNFVPSLAPGPALRCICSQPGLPSR